MGVTTGGGPISLIFRFIPTDIRYGEVCHGRRGNRVIKWRRHRVIRSPGDRPIGRMSPGNGFRRIGSPAFLAPATYCSQLSRVAVSRTPQPSPRGRRPAVAGEGPRYEGGGPERRG